MAKRKRGKHGCPVCDRGPFFASPDHPHDCQVELDAWDEREEAKARYREWAAEFDDE